MTPIALVVPGSLQARTGGYIYDRHMVDGLRRLGRRVDVLELDASFPHPTPAALEHADRTLAAIRPGTITIVEPVLAKVRSVGVVEQAQVAEFREERLVLMVVGRGGFKLRDEVRQVLRGLSAAFEFGKRRVEF